MFCAASAASRALKRCRSKSDGSSKSEAVSNGEALVRVRDAVAVRIGAGFDDAIGHDANHDGRRAAGPARTNAHFCPRAASSAATVDEMRSSSSKSPRFQA